MKYSLLCVILLTGCSTLPSECYFGESERCLTARYGHEGRLISLKHRIDSAMIRGANCVEHATIAYGVLSAAGYKPRIVASCPFVKACHASVMIEAGGETFVFDNGAIRRTGVTDIMRLYEFNEYASYHETMAPKPFIAFGLKNMGQHLPYYQMAAR